MYNDLTTMKEKKNRKKIYLLVISVKQAFTGGLEQQSLFQKKNSDLEDQRTLCRAVLRSI